MIFYCLHEGFYEGIQLRLDQIRVACEKLNIDFVSLNSLNTDYSNLPILRKEDMLYNVGRGSETLETLLLKKDVKTFYKKNPDYVVANSDTTKYSILHKKANLPGPKTIYDITADRKLLKKYIAYLGGFPIIIKATGSTRGIGTIKIDSWQNLVSTVDYLILEGKNFILREFIKAKSGCRMIVLDNEVIASASFLMNENDFRNAVDLSQVKYRNRPYPEKLNQIAIRATEIANTELGGVDFLEDENGNFYLLEINFPTGFSNLINVCSVDIPLKMVEYLKMKRTDGKVIR